MKLFSRKPVSFIAKSDYDKAVIQSLKAQSALEDADAEVKKLNARILRVTNLLTMGARTTAAIALLRDELYESNVALLAAHNAQEYAQSEVESQSVKLRRLQQYLDGPNNEKTSANRTSTAK